MHILITGAGGYIGTTLIPMLLEKGHQVRAVDRWWFGRQVLTNSQRLEIVDCDARDLSAEHFNGIDAVIDLVAISNDPAGEMFRAETWEINRRARARCAALAKRAGASRYILPSSCAIYGYRTDAADEWSTPNPLTTYSKANLAAERDVLRLADDRFCVTVLRQATAYGVSPRMRFDLSLNIMTYDAVMRGVVHVGRGGDQWRPFAHVRDLASAQAFMLDAPAEAVNGQVFNVGGENVQMLGLAEMIAHQTGAKITWVGQPDQRSYRVAFGKIEALGWARSTSLSNGIREVTVAVREGLDRTPDTITLDWYNRVGAFEAPARAALAG